MKKIVVLCAILAIIFLVCLVFQFCLFSTNSGQVFPVSLPDERNRIFFNEEHASCSIIAPEGWSTNLGSSIRLYSDANASSSSRPLGTMYVVGGHDSPPFENEDAIKQMDQVQFFEHIAYTRSYETPSRELFGSSLYVFEVFLNINNRWYVLGYSTNRKLTEMPPKIVWEYFNTFKISTMP